MQIGKRNMKEKTGKKAANLELNLIEVNGIQLPLCFLGF